MSDLTKHDLLNCGPLSLDVIETASAYGQNVESDLVPAMKAFAQACVRLIERDQKAPDLLAKSVVDDCYLNAKNAIAQYGAKGRWQDVAQTAATFAIESAIAVAPFDAADQYGDRVAAKTRAKLSEVLRTCVEDLAVEN